MFFLLLGSVVAALVPPMIVIYENRDSYGQMAWIFAAVGIVIFLGYLPGHFESKALKQRYAIEQWHKPDSFLKTLKLLLSQKNFMIVVLIFFLDGILGTSLNASIQYVIKYNLQLQSDSTIFVMAGWIAGALLSLFPWLIFANKLKNNRKMMIWGVFLNCLTLILCGLFWDLPSLIVGTLLLGIGGSALRIARNPIIADVMDEALVKSGHHNESSLMGIYTFFNRFSLIIQGWIFSIVHLLTQFNPDAIVQTPLALLGIRMHTAFIPAVLCIIGLILFVKVYDLSPEKTKHNQQMIKEKSL
jgi:Na+/melibiose symporter-like transporter